MGVLAGAGANGSATAGVEIALATITVDADATIAITANVVRGGIVGDAVVAGTIAGGEITLPVGPACVCKGDTNESGNVSLADLSVIVGFLSPAYAGTSPPYTCVAPLPAGSECYDINEDGKISLADLSVIVGFLSPTYAGTSPPYSPPPGVCIP